MPDDAKRRPRPARSRWRRATVRRRLAARLQIYGAKYRADPSNVESALRYAQALRATGQSAQAVAVLEELSMQNPNNKVVLGEYGRALADAGEYEQALDSVRPRPHARTARLANPVRTGRGARPNGPARRKRNAIISPRSRSFPTSRRCCPISDCPTRCRRTLRTPRRRCGSPWRSSRPIRGCGRIWRWWSAWRAASPRPKQIARADLPPDQAAANVAYLRQMLAHKGDAAADQPGRAELPRRDRS